MSLEKCRVGVARAGGLCDGRVYMLRAASPELRDRWCLTLIFALLPCLPAASCAPRPMPHASACGPLWLTACGSWRQGRVSPAAGTAGAGKHHTPLPSSTRPASMPALVMAPRLAQVLTLQGWRWARRHGRSGSWRPSTGPSSTWCGCGSRRPTTRPPCRNHLLPPPSWICYPVSLPRVSPCAMPHGVTACRVQPRATPALKPCHVTRVYCRVLTKVVGAAVRGGAAGARQLHRQRRAGRAPACSPPPACATS
jgi:hypothetical protein